MDDSVNIRARPSAAAGATAIELIQQHLAQTGADALIAVSEERVFNLSHVRLVTQSLIAGRDAYVIVPRTGIPLLIVGDIEHELARGSSLIADIATYSEASERPAFVLAERIAALGLSQGRIAIERFRLHADLWDTLRSELADVTWESGEPFLAAAQAVKSGSALDALEHAAFNLDCAIATATASGGVATEADLALRIRRSALERGLEDLPWLLMSSGESSHLLHQFPGPRPLRAGTVLRIDLGARHAGYLVDMARTFSVGQSTSAQRDWYCRLWATHEATIAAIVPGASAESIYRTCVAAGRSAGIDIAAHQIGHAIGLQVQEPPYLRPGDETELQAGMVLCVEPRVRSAHGLMHVEDVVVVTEAGTRVVSRSQPWNELPTVEAAESRGEELEEGA